MNTDIVVDLDMIKKYDQPGPRYTSYPTAPYFHDGVTEKDYIEHIQKDEKSHSVRNLSLYFHLPFCKQLCYFCGCNSFVTHNSEMIKEYITYLGKEMQLISPLLGQDRQVVQLHWGGGTPTYLSPDQIRHLGDMVRKYFNFSSSAQVGVEIDPRGLERDHFKALHEMGFNRCSMGVQDFDPQVQQAVHRVQPETITRQALQWAREFHFESMNVDLMYGLPYQTVKSFAETIDKVIDMGPDRLAVFNYAHLPNIFRHQRVIKDDTLPKPEVKLDLLKLTIEKLTAAGYVYIGMDHFAKPDDELTLAMQQGTLYRNFQGYSTHAGVNLFALGMSSISMLSDLYVQNHKTLDTYYAPLNEGRLPVMRGVQLTADDIVRRDVITELMCNFVLTKQKISDKYDIDFDNYFADALEGLRTFEDDSLLMLGPDAIKVLPAGRMLIRNIAMKFDCYMQQKKNDKPQFSRTV